VADRYKWIALSNTTLAVLISAPFRDGLHTAFGFAIVACLVAAAASFLRGGRYHHAEEPSAPQPVPAAARALR
jgi:hypothetical protein